MQLTRRALLVGASMLALTQPAAAASLKFPALQVTPVPTRFIRLRPSPFADAAAANQRYLLSLDTQRLLHNFYTSAQLPAPKPLYGGWESLGIAGHTLGHWLSACSLVVAQSGDRSVAAALDFALAEMALIQTKHGDGYCGGTTVDRDGKRLDGKIIFEELRHGDIRPQGFDLNDGWVPLYTWHKIHAGLLDAHVLAGNIRALPIALSLAGYLASILESLNDEQMQELLRIEHGGLNESYAQTYALTGDTRWLRIAEKLRHTAVLDPLVEQRDELAGLHANTQIPKLIGLARLYEITGEPRHAVAARFFHQTVTRRHSYVIGGNSDREHFAEPGKIAGRLTEATCEACNSYNMLKLTRHLYGWQPQASWFDYYERVQLNHILAHQRPDTGQFAYFMPMASGSRRTYSEPEDSFWCCVGSGMESHAKHADSIYWSDGSTLFINLFIPSDLDWTSRNIALTLDASLHDNGTSNLVFHKAPRAKHAIALRLPGWAREPQVLLNGRPLTPLLRNGYAVVERIWRAGDTLSLTARVPLSVETAPDDPSIMVFMHGPLVLAADLGPAKQAFDGIGPALIVEGPAEKQLRNGTSRHRFRARGALGEDLALEPFYSLHDRRAAVYFPTFTSADWATVKPRYLASQQAAADLVRRTTDILYLGEMQSERDHEFNGRMIEVVNWKGRSARRIRQGGQVRLTMAREGATVLRVVVWGTAIDNLPVIHVDGDQVTPRTDIIQPGDHFVSIDYPIGSGSVSSASRAPVLITPAAGEAVVYEIRMLKSEG